MCFPADYLIYERLCGAEQRYIRGRGAVQEHAVSLTLSFLLEVTVMLEVLLVLTDSEEVTTAPWAASPPATWGAPGRPS